MHSTASTGSMPDDEKTLENVKNFVFDLDHTVWYWSELAPGVKRTIRRLKANNKRVFYATNNSLLTREELAKKLSDLGLKTKQEHIISSPYVAAKTFVQKGIEEVYAVGESGLVDELEAEHIKTSKDADHVVVGMDRNFSFWKAAQAADLVREGADLWTVGQGSVFRAGDRYLPGTKALLNTVITASGADEVRNAGKPSRFFFKRVKEEFPIMPGNAVFIGDSIQTDVVLGNKLGLKTGLVLSGLSSEEDVRDVDGLEVPDFVFRSFDRITRKL